MINAGRQTTEQSSPRPSRSVHGCAHARPGALPDFRLLDGVPAEDYAWRPGDRSGVRGIGTRQELSTLMPDDNPIKAPTNTHARPAVAVRLANSAGRLLRRAGLPLVHLDRDRLIAKACRRDGLDDFGDIDIIEPLDVLLDSLERDAKLTLAGRVVARCHLARLLHQRLLLEHTRRTNPQIREQRIAPPIFITGMPRSGSTFLHRLLSRDPAARTTLAWESMHPDPPPQRATYDTDPRIRLARRQIAGFRLLAPQFHAIHDLGAQLPQECIEILSYSFCSAAFETMYSVDAYSHWLKCADMTNAYTIHRRVLQHLQWQCPAHRWVLKAPAHLFHLQELIASYPDAMIVQTHREPLEVLGSVASLTATLRGAFSDSIDPTAIGREVSQRWGQAATLSIEMRNTAHADTDRFFDVRYEDLVMDPMTVIGRLYEYFELELTSAVESKMREYVVEVSRKRRKQQPHQYSIDSFGLVRAHENKRFQAYRERFNIGAQQRHAKRPVENYVTAGAGCTVREDLE